MSFLLASSALLAAPCPSACPDLKRPPSDQVPVPADEAHEPDLEVSPLWFGMQLVPNPSVSLGRGSPHLRLSWQITPLLFSFATDPRLSPWRSFMVEPIVRHGGSIELLLTPEYVSWPSRFNERWGYRLGLRSTFGLVERGDYLSISLGTGYLSLAEGDSVEYELGAYVLFGNLGLTVSYAPRFDRTVYTVSLRTRFF